MNSIQILGFGLLATVGLALGNFIRVHGLRATGRMLRGDLDWVVASRAYNRHDKTGD